MCHADLEIGLHRRHAFQYTIDLRYSTSDSETDEWVSGEIQIDFDRLRSLSLEDQAYGELLTQTILRDEAVKSRFLEAMQVSAAKEHDLRIRLFIGPTAPELHSLRWERMKNPRNGGPLLTRDRIQFCRYLSSHDWRPVSPRAKSELRALLAIANPEDLTSKGLPPIDGAAEQKLAENALACETYRLVQRGEATLENIIQHLRKKTFDILYLVCHGVYNEESHHPALFLEDANGRASLVDGLELARRIEELHVRPRLIVFASCESGGNEADSEVPNQLAALGPRLAEAGVPAVLALHGKFSIGTAEKFFPCFFNELAKDGQIDRALAVARSGIQDRPDWWCPVLFMRLRSGRLWFSRGLAAVDGGGLDQWKALINNIKKKRCTPILGPGLTDYLLGSRREIVRNWAETERYPMSPSEREHMPQVAQYLLTRHDELYLRDRLDEWFSGEMKRRYESQLRNELALELSGKNVSTKEFETYIDRRFENLPFLETIHLIGGQEIRKNPTEPHRVLASLGLPLYITANFCDLAANALTAEGRQPRVAVYRWREDDALSFDTDEIGDHWKPSEEEPLVYHLFGHLKKPDSVVLSEDDYFDYLLSLDRNKSHFPSHVGSALNKTALLLLGFRMDDWGFRVLFRSIVRRGGSALRRRFSHVAVQLDPDEGSSIEPEKARIYLTKYFDSANISVYWGNVQDFVSDLQERLTSN